MARYLIRCVPASNAAFSRRNQASQADHVESSPSPILARPPFNACFQPVFLVLSSSFQSAEKCAVFSGTRRNPLFAVTNIGSISHDLLVGSSTQQDFNFHQTKTPRMIQGVFRRRTPYNLLAKFALAISAPVFAAIDRMISLSSG
jgi:hypothetical protein